MAENTSQQTLRCLSAIELSRAFGNFFSGRITLSEREQHLVGIFALNAVIARRVFEVDYTLEAQNCIVDYVLKGRRNKEELCMLGSNLAEILNMLVDGNREVEGIIHGWKGEIDIPRRRQLSLAAYRVKEGRLQPERYEAHAMMLIDAMNSDKPIHLLQSLYDIVLAYGIMIDESVVKELKVYNICYDQNGQIVGRDMLQKPEYYRFHAQPEQRERKKQIETILREIKARGFKAELSSGVDLGGFYSRMLRQRTHSRDDAALYLREMDEALNNSIPPQNKTLELAGAYYIRKMFKKLSEYVGKKR